MVREWPSYLLLVILAVAPNERGNANEVNRLTGWQEFKFGMSAEKVQAATKLPLRCKAPLKPSFSGTRMMYSGSIKFEGSPAELQLNFSDLASDVRTCSGGRLSVIVIRSASLTEPCPLEKIYRSMTRTYGRFNVIDLRKPNGVQEGARQIPMQFGRYFDNSGRIFVSASGHEGACDFIATFSLANLPVARNPTSSNIEEKVRETTKR